MILSGHEIRQQLGSNIIIDPFDEAKLNPNSYNLSLHDELLVYQEVVLDMRKSNRVVRVFIPEDGLVLTPNQLYLGRSVERDLMQMRQLRAQDEIFFRNLNSPEDVARIDTPSGRVLASFLKG